MLLRWAVPPFGKRSRIGGQQVQFVCPELRHKFTEVAHPLGIEPVVPVPPFLACSDQARFLQQQQVLRDGGAADLEVRGQIADRLLAAGQEMEQPTPIGLSSYLQGIQHIQYVSDH